MRTEDVMDPLGVYIHIPFCKSKCAYCDFYSIPESEPRRMEEFVRALLIHLRECQKLYRSYLVDTVYFGGGTPSCLPVKMLQRLLKAVQKTFVITGGAEITMEVNPETLEAEDYVLLKEAGVTRISIGAQSSNDDELKMLGRIHDFERVRQAVKDARAAGFDNISIDLMYGLPGQTKATLQQSLDDVIALEPEHISAYALKLEEGTPMAKQGVTLPDDDIVANRYMQICRCLGAYGFEHYEISNFCKPGFRSRHNSKYWDLSEYLGLGPGAHSFMNHMRYSAIKDVDRYCECIRKNLPIIDECDDEPVVNRIGEYIMLHLRTAEGIDIHDFETRFRMDLMPYITRLDEYKEHGLVRCDGESFALTEVGWFVSNAIILEILTALEENSPIPQTEIL